MPRSIQMVGLEWTDEKRAEWWLLLLGETLSFESLIYSLFEFVQVLMDVSTYKNSVKTSMEELCYYLILCMQITEEEVIDALSLAWMEGMIICFPSSSSRGRRMSRDMSKMKVMIPSRIPFDCQPWNSFW